MNIPNQKNKGFTLFIAMIVMATLMLITGGVVSLAVRQSMISSSGRESEAAFYAADTGLECALYWDVHNPTDLSAFSPAAPPSTIFCNQDGNNSGNHWVVGGTSVTVINNITFLPDPYCAIVTVTKNGAVTTIESQGYNTCSNTSRRVERAVRATY